MKALLSFPSAYGDPETGFISKRGITDDDFVDEFEKDFRKRYNPINNTIRQRFGKNMSINSYQKESNFYEKIKYEYNDIDCVILTPDMRQETIDNLIEYYKTGEQFGIVLRLFDLNNNPDVDTDVKEWWKSTLKIMNSDMLTPEEKMANYPMKDLRVTFTNAKSKAYLHNCKVLSRNKVNEYVLIVESIIFVTDK